MEYHLQYLTKQSQCCVLLGRLTERGCWGCFYWRWERSLWRMTFSRIMDRNGRLEMGQYIFKRFFLSSNGFFNKSLTMAIFSSHGTMQEAGGGWGGGHSSGFQRKKIRPSVARDRGSTGSKITFFSVLYSSLLLQCTAALNALSLNTGSTWLAGDKQYERESRVRICKNRRPNVLTSSGSDTQNWQAIWKRE